MRKLLLFILVLSSAPSLAQRAQAEVRVPAIIGDNMVVQQGRKARLWGTAQPETVTVTRDELSGDSDAEIITLGTAEPVSIELRSPAEHADFQKRAGR
jgi:hypothetical protein